MSKHQFQVGGSLEADASCYVVSSSDEKIYKALIDSQIWVQDKSLSDLDYKFLAARWNFADNLCGMLLIIIFLS